MSDADAGSPSGMRAANRERILALLRARGPMSQADLARASGLSPATISGIARELREAGWLEGDDADVPVRGRALALSRSAGVAVGIDFGHSHVRVAIADLAHTVLAESEEALDVDHEADEGVALAGRLVRRLLDEVGVAADRVTGVGMGLPGPLRRDSGEVGDSAILPGWIGARPEALMQAELGLPVRVENDANLGALAEIVWGAGRDCTDLVYVKVATGVGAGLVLNGRLYHGAGGTAGEIGHVTIDDGGPVCRCGNRGCLEAFAGAEAVLEPLRRRHGDRLTLRQVVLQAQAGDVGCRRVIADAGRALGRAVAGTCNLLSPERVLVGGELAQAGDLLLESAARGRRPLGHRRHPRGPDPRRRPGRARRGPGRRRPRPARVPALRGRAGARPLGHLPRPDVAAREVLGLAVAVGAEEHEVLEAVVVVDPIEVVQTQRQWSASPSRDPAFLAPLVEQPETHEPLLEVGSVALARDELLDGHPGGARHDRATLDSLVPGCRREAELRLALANGMPGVVVRLDGRPVLPALRLGWKPETTHVVRDRRRRDAETCRDRPLGQAFGVEAEDEVPARHEQMFATAPDTSNTGHPTRTAAGLGFEPRLTIPETVVLPLHHPAEY